MRIQEFTIMRIQEFLHLTDLKELRVHAVKVADEEDGDGTGGIKKQQITSREIQDETSAVHHHYTDKLHRQDHPNKTTWDSHFKCC